MSILEIGLSTIESITVHKYSIELFGISTLTPETHWSIRCPIDSISMKSDLKHEIGLYDIQVFAFNSEINVSKEKIDTLIIKCRNGTTYLDIVLANDVLALTWIEKSFGNRENVTIETFP